MEKPNKELLRKILNNDTPKVIQLHRQDRVVNDLMFQYLLTKLEEKRWIHKIK